ncbi:hypothetical protein [Legionella quateirensis]|nr:hypothetical protein [Legionella quateirensis]
MKTWDTALWAYSQATPADSARFKEDYKYESIKGSVYGYIAEKEHSVILNDYGTGSIYCSYESS